MFKGLWVLWYEYEFLFFRFQKIFFCCQYCETSETVAQPSGPEVYYCSVAQKFYNYELSAVDVGILLSIYIDYMSLELCLSENLSFYLSCRIYQRKLA